MNQVLSDDEISRLWSSKAVQNATEFARAIESTILAKLADTLKDAERLDAIEKNCRTDPKMDGNHVYWPTTWEHSLKGPNLRAAIDAQKDKQ